MAGGEGVEARDLITLVVDGVGAVVATDVIWDPYRLVDPGGEVVAAVSEFLEAKINITHTFRRLTTAANDQG